MNKILILFAHPRYEKSRINRALRRGLAGLENVTVHDLYEEYPDFNIDVPREQKLLREHDIIVWHYPLYLYGPPALIKQWMDLVLEHGWAHGEGATSWSASRFSISSPAAAPAPASPPTASTVSP